MAKSKWPQVQEKLVLVEAWCRDGLIELDIAKRLGISEKTLNTYKLEHPQFLQALKRGKEVVDVEVENSLLKRAQGYDYFEDVTETEVDHNGEIIRSKHKSLKKHMPADVTAQMFWLQNRKPDTWRRNQEPLIGEEALQKLDGILEGITRKMADDNGN